MKRFLLITVLFLTGCSTTYYTDGKVKIRHTRFGGQNIEGAVLSRDAFGKLKFGLQKQQSDTGQIQEAVDAISGSAAPIKK
jgi:hypothetical protein